MMILECDITSSVSIDKVPKALVSVWNKSYSPRDPLDGSMISIWQDHNTHPRKIIRYYDLSIEMTIIDSIFRVEAPSQKDFDTILSVITLYGFLQ